MREIPVASFFFFFSLAPRIPRAYKEIVSSWSSGGLHESTGLRSTSKLSTPLLRCESRANWLKVNLLAKRRRKEKRGPSSRALFVFTNSRINLDPGLVQFTVGLSFSPLSTGQQAEALLRCRLMRGVLVFPAVFLRMMAFMMML